MLFFKKLCLALLPALALAAKSPSANKFDEFHTKSLSSTPLKLADTSYDKLTSGPRDYSVVVLLTALEARFGCQMCRDFQPDWELLAKSWTRGDKKGESRLIYGTLDFADGRNTFQSVSCLRFFRRGCADGLNSSAYKQRLCSFTSHLPQVHMPLRTLSPSGSTLRLGTMISEDCEFATLANCL